MGTSITDLLAAADGKRLVVFDLDNTLIDEWVYLRNAYAAVARIASDGDEREALAIAEWLQAEFRSSGRKNLFDRMAAAWPTASGNLARWLDAFRTAEMPLEMLSWVEPFCDGLVGVSFAILTNGNADQQRNKFALLQRSGNCRPFRLYCAIETESKPSPAGLIRILQDHNCVPSDAVMIGDSEVDRICAEATGVSFILAPNIPMRRSISRNNF